MNYYISDDVPEAWINIIDTFITVAEYSAEFNGGEPIDNLRAKVRYGKLYITYSGGDRVTDAFAFFAKEMSSATCSECGMPSKRLVFGSPKCNDCD